MASERNLSVFSDASTLASGAAELFAQQAKDAVAARGRFSVALAGGQTPNDLYVRLAGRDDLPWDSIHVFWGDERHVPPDHRDSNFRAASETLLTRVPIAPAHVHRIRGELPDASTAAAEYEQALRREFPVDGTTPPVFDLVLLGLGADGHTASLFPGSEALHEDSRLALAPFIPQVRGFRITLTLPVLNGATSVVFLVSGAEKAKVLQGVLEGPEQPTRFPAQAVQPVHGRLHWFVDAAAAARLRPRSVHPS